MHAYIGADAGERVLAGQFHRGDVRQIQAAVWFSDLRGFTTLSSQLSSTDLVATLNAYFGALAPALAAHGGEVLKYIGDAILAVFAVRPDRDATQACRDAVAAAQAASVALQHLNQVRQAESLVPLDHGIGLHFGQAEYGNIGSPGRVDFTVIGRDVNLASRVEGRAANYTTAVGDSGRCRPRRRSRLAVAWGIRTQRHCRPARGFCGWQ